MFKPSNVLLASIGHSLRGPLMRASIVALLIPVSALAGIASPSDDPGPVRPAAGDKTPKAAGGYQLRCWQEGRLLFEENHIALPASDGAPYRIRLAATDRKGQPLYVAETSNATCLIRKAPADERGR